MEYKKIGIIVAMNKEFELVKNLLSDTHEKAMVGFTFCSGNLQEKEIILLKSGIGKVNAAIATTEMLQQFKPDCIINTGVAGGIDESLHVGDIVVGEETTYHDFFAGEINDHQAELGFPEKIAAHKTLINRLKQVSIDNRISWGLICTGDQFITNKDELMKIKKKHPQGLAVDMESNSIAQVCFYYQIPFVSFRIISDTPWVDNHSEQYLNFWQEAPQKTFALLEKLLKKL